MIFFARSWPSTVARTAAPFTRGAPTVTLSPSDTSRTRSRVTSAPGVASRSSTRSVAPSSTRYCFPPLSITAYMQISPDLDRPTAQLRPRRHHGDTGTGPWHSITSRSAEQSPQPREETVAPAAGRRGERHLLLLVGLGEPHGVGGLVVDPEELLALPFARRFVERLDGVRFDDPHPLHVRSEEHTSELQSR